MQYPECTKGDGAATELRTLSSIAVSDVPVYGPVRQQAWSTVKEVNSIGYGALRSSSDGFELFSIASSTSVH